MKVVKTNDERRAHGTDRPDREVNLSGGLEELPKPDAWMKLSTRAKKIYKGLGERLVNSSKDLQEFDTTALAMLASWLDRWALINEEMARMEKEKPMSSIIQEFRTGAKNITAELTALEKCNKHIIELASKFGLTLKDRYFMRDGFGKMGEQQNLLAEFFGMKEAQ